jgi:hypothetical protein
MVPNTFRNIAEQTVGVTQYREHDSLNSRATSLFERDGETGWIDLSLSPTSTLVPLPADPE